MPSPCRRTVVAAIIPFLIFASCDRQAASAKVPSEVIAAESFLADIAQNVAGDRVAIGTLIGPDSDPHEFQPRPTDIARVKSAKALLVNGLGYEAWLEPAMASLRGTRIVALAGGAPGGTGTGGDPHLWMAPRNVISYVEAVRALLTELYPNSAEAFAKNAAAYDSQLLALDGRIRDLVGALPPERRLLLTNHDALGNFAAAYGFRIAGTVLPGTSSESAPSARALAALVDTIRSSGARAIFLDVGENAAIAREIAKESGVSVVTDLHVEGISAAGGSAPSYIAMLEHDARIITNALR